jgi:hypothetical protein
VPFSIVVTGTDGSGAPYRRQFSKLFRPQTVRVAFSETPVAVQAGSSTQLTAVIENLGTTAATFAVEASTSVGTVRDLSPASVVLNPGAARGGVQAEILPVRPGGRRAGAPFSR